MKNTVKTVALCLSLLLNALFFLLFILAAQSKNTQISVSVPDGHLSAATVACFPRSSELVFAPIEVTLKPREAMTLQYSLISGRRQSNILIAALYDPQIVSVSPTGAGIEIRALAEGQTLMQTVTNEGIKDIALVTVAE